MLTFKRFFGTLVTAIVLSVSSKSLAQAPTAQFFEPPGGKGPGVLLVSGQGGPNNYVAVAKQFAAQGFHVSLIDGNDVFKPNNAGQPAFVASISALRSSPKTSPGKIGVVGSSLGGGATMTYAARMPDQVAAAVAYYPYTAFIQNPDAFARQIKVPTLVLAAVKDTYKNCCVIDMARKLAGAAKAASSTPMLELVEYPEADHGFNLAGPTTRASDAADALKRAIAHLRAGLGAAAKSK